MEQPSQAAKLEPPASQRLDSWKDIASHLLRSVRTVQRWEKQEGLPVYRHLHSKRGSIYAYRPELDTWWNNHRAVLELDVESDRISFLRTQKAFLWVSFAILLLALAGSGWWAKEKFLKSQKAVLPFQERDWVLVARFENRAAETLFDGTLEYALERELSNSRYVNVVPHERIEDALRLMKKPLKTAVDAAFGREVCLRDGNIQALVSGRVEKLGSVYVLSAQLMDATRGVAVASRSEEALGEKAIPAAIRRLSNWVREKVGEALPLIEHDNQKLEKVTTPSLRALQLFTQADVLLHQGHPAPSAELLKAALKEDPEFAAAHMWMAWAIQNQGKPAAEYLPHAERALQLSGSTSERERYLIEAKYYSIRGEAEKAIPVYEALLRLYPDDYWGMNNLAGAYRVTNRLPEALRLYLRRAELHPNNFIANWMAAYNLSMSGDADRAEPYVKRVQRLMSGETLLYQTAWIHFFPLRKYWLQGNLPKTVSELTRLIEAAKSYSGETQGALLSSAGHVYLAMGKFKAAEELFQNDLDLALAAFAKGDQQSLRGRLQSYLKNVNSPTQVGAVVVLLLARSGLIVEARRALSVLEKRGFPEGYVKIVQGELALTQGEIAGARTLLTDGVGKLRKTGTGSFFLGSESLSTACIRQGDLHTARSTLEQASGERVQATFFPGYSLTFWMRIQVKLAEVYRKLGRQSDAEKTEKELLTLLADADPDYPLARSLKAVAETRPSK